jgi:hypothetical protein
VLGHQVKRPGKAEAGGALLAAGHAYLAAAACFGEIEAAAGSGREPARVVEVAGDDRDLVVMTLCLLRLLCLRPCGRRRGQAKRGSQAQGCDTSCHDESPVMDCGLAQ